MNSYRIVRKRNEPPEQEQEPVAAVAAVETRIVSVTKPKKRVRSLAGRARKLERDIGLGHAGGTRRQESEQGSKDKEQLEQEKKQLVLERAAQRSREEGMEQEMKQVYREAASTTARGLRSEVWAHEMVHGEAGAVLSQEARAVSLRAQMQDAGASQQQARRAAAQVQAQMLAAVDPKPSVRALTALSAGEHVSGISDQIRALPWLLLSRFTQVSHHSTTSPSRGVSSARPSVPSWSPIDISYLGVCNLLT